MIDYVIPTNHKILTDDFLSEDRLFRRLAIPRNTGKWDDYERGKQLLLHVNFDQWGLHYDRVIKALADWVGV